LFSLAKIYDSQKNLYETDLFRSATVTPQEVPPDQTTIPVTVNVQEKKRGPSGWAWAMGMKNS
jgi:outer membrane translocation and assembly module TamA